MCPRRIIGIFLPREKSFHEKSVVIILTLSRVIYNCLVTKEPDETWKQIHFHQLKVLLSSRNNKEPIYFTIWYFTGPILNIFCQFRMVVGSFLIYTLIEIDWLLCQSWF